jgi:hypothetical protein
MGHRRTAHLKKLSARRAFRRVQRLADAHHNGGAIVDAFVTDPSHLTSTQVLVERLRAALYESGLPVAVANGVMLGLGIKTLADAGGSSRMIYDVACAITGEPNLLDHAQAELQRIANEPVH